MIAPSDCEMISSGLLEQPVNAVSSLAFVVVALMVRRRPVLAVLAAGVGVGSFLFHGLGGFAAEWAHDVTLCLILVGLVAENRKGLLVGLGIVVAIAFWAQPQIAEPVTIVTAVATAARLGLAGQMSTRHGLSAIIVLAASAGLGALARTDGPFCDPGSVLQGHALWHVGAATALLVWSHGPVASARSLGNSYRRNVDS